VSATAGVGEVPAVSIEGLSLRFGDLLAVSDVSLQVRQGEFVSVVGPSGCGKTTILNLIAGLLSVAPAAGTCLVNGRAPSPGNREISYMLARDALCPWRTALGNAEIGAEVRGVGVEQRRKVARGLLKDVGLGDFEDVYPKALSQGMRQRTALARTFAVDAPLLLMDEPFGALDAQTKLQLEDVLLSLWERMRRTVVFITHDLSEAVSMSDRVIVMSARPGRIIADIPVTLGRPRSVRALQKEHAYHDLYSEIWTRLEKGLAA